MYKHCQKFMPSNQSLALYFSCLIQFTEFVCQLKVGRTTLNEYIFCHFERNSETDGRSTTEIHSNNLVDTIRFAICRLVDKKKVTLPLAMQRFFKRNLWTIHKIGFYCWTFRTRLTTHRIRKKKQLKTCWKRDRMINNLNWKGTKGKMKEKKNQQITTIFSTSAGLLLSVDSRTHMRMRWKKIV